MSNKSYDSKGDTLQHINRVNELMTVVTNELLKRAENHDKSKLEDYEKKYFDELTPKLKGSTYGSDEYKQFLKELKIALDHHYENNSHHPEHYKNGVDDFDLFDLIEMFIDWKSASERHENGDIRKSVVINKDRFNISEQICKIFNNTIDRMNW